ncbi:hypothetical protein Droror1_Dr00010854 [Drosera rotundifolia]
MTHLMTVSYNGDVSLLASEGDCYDVSSSMALLLSQRQEENENQLSSDDDDATNPELLRRYISSIDSTLVIRQLSSRGLSFQLWPAATSLVSLLDDHRRNHSGSPLSSVFPSSGEEQPHGLRILELGSGTGFVGIAAAAILKASVTITDLGHVVPNLKFNVMSNSDMLASNNGNVDVAELNWGHLDHMEAIGRDYDVIIGSDVVYHDHLFDPLIETLKYFLLGVDKKVVFLIAHLKRWKKESAFFKKARKHFVVDVLHKDCPPEGQRLGVVVYCFVGKQ